jgi:thymidine kinase
MKYDTIGIDQAQLFPDVPQFAQLLANSGKIVIVAGVDGNYERKPFGTFLNIMPCCETLRKLSSICPETGLDAAFTRLLADDTHTPASRTSYFGIPTKGFIHLIIGPSKAGKESELFRMLMRYAIALRKCILVRPITKTGLPNPQPLPESGGMTKMIPVIESDALPPGESLLEYDAIGISKGHRYVGLGEWADGCANAGKVVIIAAADGDQNQEPYRGIVELLPRCEQVHKLDAMCFKTGQPAPFWVFEGNRKIAVSRQALLGGAGNLAGNLSE